MVRTWGRIVAGLVLAGAVGAGAGCGGCDRAEGPPPFLAFGCGEGQRFLACFTAPDSALLVTPEGVQRLVRIPAASGVRYAGAADTLWTRGEEATLVRRDLVLKGCEPTGRQQVLANLWREGALFTAAGNEPFWTLTAWPDSLVLVRDLGSTRLSRVLTADHPWRGAAAGWQDPSADIAVTATPGPCLDTMSGAPFPWRVTVRWGGQEFTGCGLDLRPGR